MSSPEHTEIWRERLKLDDARLQFMRQAMAEFDREHYAKLRALQARCAKLGHVRGTFHENGFGGSWFYCNQCGAKMQETVAD